MKSYDKHIEALTQLFPEFDPANFSTLQDLEKEARTLNEEWANGDLSTSTHERLTERLLFDVCALLGCEQQHIEFDSDPRGYAFKIVAGLAKSVEGLEHDFVRYGIVAPQ